MLVNLHPWLNHRDDCLKYQLHLNPVPSIEDQQRRTVSYFIRFALSCRQCICYPKGYPAKEIYTLKNDLSTKRWNFCPCSNQETTPGSVFTWLSHFFHWSRCLFNWERPFESHSQTEQVGKNVSFHTITSFEDWPHLSFFAR